MSVYDALPAMPAPLDMATPAPDADGYVDLGPVVLAARVAAGCDTSPYPGAIFEPWFRIREAQVDRMLADWHRVPHAVDGRMRGADGEVVTFAASPRFNCQARVTPVPRGLVLVDVEVSSSPMRVSGLGACLLSSRAYADRGSALCYAVDYCLDNFRVGRGARYVKIIAKLEAAAAALAPAPVAAPTLAEIVWGPQLVEIAAREAAGIADDFDASIRAMAERSIAAHVAHAAHMARCEALAARFA